MKTNLEEKQAGNIDYTEAEKEANKLYGKGFNNLKPQVKKVFNQVTEVEEYDE